MNNVLTISETKRLVKGVLVGLPVDIYDEDTDAEDVAE